MNDNKTSKSSDVALVKSQTDEIDIYSDILTDQDDKITKLTQKVEKLSSEKVLLINSLNNQQNKFDELKRDHEELQKKYGIVTLNCSSLFKTAQAEVQRKDRTIQELRRELDNLVFRKIPISKAVGRSGKVLAEVDNKARSPLKKKGPVEPEASYVENTEADDESNIADGVNSVSEQFVDEDNNHKKVNSYVVPTSNITSAIITPPVLHGPVTEYSKRMYKKIYGSNPPQTFLVEESKVKTGSNPDDKESRLIKSSADNSHIEERTEDKKPNKEEIKSPRIAAKLQEQVKEFIRLGTNSNSKTKVNKSPPEKSNAKSPSSFKSDELNNRPLVIYCDGSGRKSGSPSVNLNETVSSILKNKRDGLYSNLCVEVTSKVTEQLANEENNSCLKEKSTNSPRNSANFNPLEQNKETDSVKFSENDKFQNNLQSDNANLHDCDKSRPNRLLTNMIKRISSKPTISPVTFGTLISSKVSQSPRNINTTRNTANKTTNSPNTSTEKLHKEKHGEKNISEKTCIPHQETVKKKSFMTSLFGESPLKPNNSVKPLEVSGRETCEEDNSSRSPLQSLTFHTDSLVLPNSPSLDSDDPDDLIIDTTACSKNTSVCGSGSSKKDEDETEISVNENNKSSIKCISMEQSEVQNNSIETHIKGVDSRSSGLSCSTEVKSLSDKSSLLIKSVEANKDLAKNRSNEIRVELTVNDKENISNTNKVSLPDLSECFSLQSKSQLEMDVKHSTTEVLENKENSLSKSAAGSQNVNVPNTNNSEFCSFLSHSSSSEMSNENNTSKTSNTSTVNSKKRFVPSPSQLSLVTALKHSDNSVFNITEDTAEFVSALTRVRDISPIRTPGKKKNQPRTSEVDDANKEISNNLATVCVEDCNSLPRKSLKDNTAVIENNLDAADFAEPLLQSTADTQTHNLKNQNFSEYLTSSQSAGNNEKSNKILKNSNQVQITKNVTTNNTSSVFRRSKPVRRIVLPNQTKETSYIKCDKETISTKINKSNCSLVSTENIPSNLVEEDKSIPNLCQYKVLETVGTAKTVALESLSNDIKCANLNTSNESSKKENMLRDRPASKKEIIIRTNCENKTFRRSESLKSMPKPLPKINYDILNNKPELKKEDNILFPEHPGAFNKYNNVDTNIHKTPKLSDSQDNVNRKEQNNSKIMVSKPPYCDKNSSILQNDSNVKRAIFIEHLSASKITTKDSVANKELEQSPHIANINKKTRISSFQRVLNPVKEGKEPKTTNNTSTKPPLKGKVIQISTEEKCSVQSHQSIVAISSEAGTVHKTVTRKSVKRSSMDTEFKKTNNGSTKSNSSSEAEINNVCPSTKKIKLTEKTNPIVSSQKKSSSKPLKNQGKNPIQNEKQLETRIQERDENNQIQTTESKIITKGKKNGLKESGENPLSQNLQPRNKSTDNQLFQKSKNTSPRPEMRSTADQRRSSSSFSDKNINHSRLSNSSSGSDVQCTNKSGKNTFRSQSKSPQSGERSKSCHQSRRIQNASPEIRKRSNSSYSRRLVQASPDFRCRDSHYRNRSSSSRSPDPRRRKSYHMPRRSRSRSRETIYFSRSRRFARSRHRDSYERYVYKHHMRRSRSKSPFWYDGCERKRDGREYRNSDYRSPDLHRKKRSRSLSLERINLDEKLKRRRQSNRNCLDEQCRSLDKGIIHDQKGLLKKGEFTPNQETSSNPEKHKRSSGIQLNQDKETLSFMDEIKEIRNVQRSRSKKEVLPPEGDKKVSVSYSKTSKVCSENQMSVSNLESSVVDESVLNGSLKVNMSEDSRCKSKTEGLQTTEVVLKNNLDVSTKTVPPQQKPIPVIKYMKRRSRNLGDSDVKVVSSSTKLSRVFSDTSKPNNSHPEQA